MTTEQIGETTGMEARLGALEGQVARLVAVSESTNSALNRLATQMEATHNDRTRIALIESEIERMKVIQEHQDSEVESIKDLVNQGRGIYWIVTVIMSAFGGIGAAVAYFKGAK